MKRKIVSMILAALMVAGMIPFSAVSALAGEQSPEILSETIEFNNSNTAESEHFRLTAGYNDSTGWSGGSKNYPITITPKNNNEKLLIRNIEAEVSYLGHYYILVGVSGGTKRENGNVNNGTTVHIDGVNDFSFSFAGGSSYVMFKDITVSYEIHTHDPVLFSEKPGTEAEHGYTASYYYCEGCGMYFSDAGCTNRIPEVTGAGYTVHNWSAWSDGGAKGHIRTCTCAGCGAVRTAAHTGYGDDGICDVCDRSGIFAETILFNGTYTAESELFTLTAPLVSAFGWLIGESSGKILISPKNNKILIRNVEGLVSRASEYDRISVSGGVKRETGSVADGTTVHIDGVDDHSFSFAGKSICAFTEITVFFEIHTHTPALFSAKEATETAHGISTSYYYCDGCSKYFSDAECTKEIAKETVDGYTVHNWDVQSADAWGHNCVCTVADCGIRSTAHVGYIDDGVCDICGYSGAFAETIVFNNKTTAGSEHFTLTAGRVGSSGWYGGGEMESITVSPKNNAKLWIRNVEAVIGFMGTCYSGVAVSGGKKRETGNVENGTTVHIDGVDAASFSFASWGHDYSQFKDITVYYFTAKTYEEILGAKAAIDAAAGEAPGKSVKRIADGAKADIDSVLTVPEVMAIRDECIADIEKLTGTVHEHTFSTVYSANEAVHWFAATCGHDDFTKGMAAHTFGEGVVDGNKTTYTCTVCGYEKTETVDETAKLLEEAQQALEKAAADLAAAEDEIAKLQEDLSGLTEKLGKADAQQAELEKEITDITARLEEKEAAIASLQSQLDAAKKEIERLKGQSGDPGTVIDVEEVEDGVCEKCGKVHADNFIGRFVCFFNRLGNFFRNLFK